MPAEHSVDRKVDRRPLILGAVFYVLAMAFWYVGAVSLGYGEAESRHDPSSLWMYTRRATMIGLSLLLPILGQSPGVREYGFRITPRYLVLAVGIGLLIGLGNRGGYPPTSIELVLGALLHTLAVEMYFRGYWIKLLEQYTASFWKPILISGSLYGLHFLTIHATYRLPAWGILPFVLLFASLGTLFGWGMRKSGLLCAWLMHFVGVLDFKSLLR
jgi:hypothetical protein